MALFAAIVAVRQDVVTSPDKRMGHIQPLEPSAIHRPNAGGLRYSLLAAIVPLAFALIPAALPGSEPAPHAGTGYVGSQACAGCHKGIYDKFAATHMGRSLSRVNAETIAALPLPGSLDDDRLRRHFEVFSRDGKLYQTESAASGGIDSFSDTHQVEWILGSGMNGFGGLIKRDDFLFQAPLSFYSQAGSWGLSPGYEFADLGFNRAILPGCITCHSGRPNAVADANGRFNQPEFLEMAIGCENCHGPGAAHIRSIQQGETETPGGAGLIVNPAKLSADLTDDICMSCHQTGDLRVLQAGKTYGDFRPGTPLDRTLSILMVPPRRESPPQADHLEHYYSMTLSKCYRASAGKMSCITCHDLHIEPSAAVAPGYFKQKCLTCHTEKSCGVPLETRLHSQRGDDCITCHMPRRDVRLISHSSITNHRILARLDEPFPDEAFQQTTAALPDLIHLNAVPGEKDKPPPALTLLQAYGELLETRPEYSDRYVAVLKGLEKTEPQSALVQSALGRRDLRAEQFQGAVDHLQSAIKIGPLQATTYSDLSEALAKLGRREEALTAIQQSIALDPFNPLAQKALVVLRIQLKQYPEAKAAMEHYLQVFPQDDFMREMLKRADAQGQPR